MSEAIPDSKKTKAQLLAELKSLRKPNGPPENTTSDGRFQDLVEGSLQGILVHDHFKMLFANRALADILEYDSVEALLNVGSVLKLLPPEERARAETNYKKRSAGEPIPVQLEYQFVSKHGKPVVFDVLTRLITWEGRPATQATFIDITARRKIDMALQQAKDNLEQRVQGRTAELQKEITEHQRTEDRLRESREQLNLITNNLPVLINYVGADRRFHYCNKTYEEWFATPIEDLIGQRIDDVLPPAAMAELVEHINKALGGQPVKLKRKISYPDGKTRMIEATYIPDPSPEGQVRGFFGLVADITAQDVAEQAMRESEQKLRAMIDHSPSGIVLKDTNGIFTVANRLYRSWRAKEEQEIIGKTVYDLYSKAYAEELEAEDQEIIKTGKPLKSDRKVLGGDGKTRQLMSIKFPVFSDVGTVIGVGSIHTDISERKKAEEALRDSEALFKTAIETIPLGLYVKDRKRRYLIENARPPFANMDVNDILGKTNEETGLFTKESCDRALKEDLAVLDEGKTLSDYDIPVSYANGTTRRYRFIKAPLRDADGNITGIVGVREDITDRVKLEEHLRESQKIDAVGQLAGGIAHDFNNLIQIILAYAQLVKQDLKNPGELGNYLDQIILAGDRAARLTRQLLAFGRKTLLERGPLNLNELAKEILGMLERVIGVDIQVSLKPDDKLFPVLADRSMMEQVLLNLCVNARDAMPSGGHLQIETKNILADEAFCKIHGWVQPGEYAQISVTDNGIGMSPEVRDHIFEPFFTTKEVGKGTGLGLATVYGIVQQHNGIVDVYSEPGIGTTLKIFLPAAKDQEAVKKKQTLTTDGGKETILVAEDEPSVRDLLRNMLERKGYRVILAKDGQEALATFQAKQASIDLVILDVVMPGLKGHQVYKQIRVLNQLVPIILSTGYSDALLETDLLKKEELRLLQKPYSPADLLRNVREALDKS